MLDGVSNSSQMFLTALNEIGINYEHYDGIDDFKITNEGNTHYIVDFDLGLNSSSISEIIKDKDRTYNYLKEANFEAIPHIKFGDSRQLANILFYDYQEPVVIKDNNTYGGENVYRLFTESELTAVLDKFENGKIKGCISPYYNSETEYQINILDGEILFGFKKVRNKDWKHNLKYGSELKEIPISELNKIKPIAKKLYKDLNIRYANVDLFKINGEFKVLDINGIARFDNLINTDNKYKAIVKESYIKSIRTLINSSITVKSLNLVISRHKTVT